MKVANATKLPSGSWRCQVMVGGCRRSVTAPTKREAEERALALKLSVSPQEVKGDSHTALDSVLRSYIEDRRAVLSPSTIRGYMTVVRTRFQSAMGAQVGSINWQKLVNDESRLVSAKTVKNAWGLVASALAYAELPVPKVRLPQLVQEEATYLTVEQVGELVKLIEGSRYELPVLLALHGLRRSEIFALRDGDIAADEIRVRGAVVPDEAHQYVRKEATKNVSSRRTVPILFDKIKELPLTQLECRPDSVSRWLEKLTERNGLPRCSLHSLRHTFASICYSQHIPELTVQRWGGWANNSTLHRIYTHLMENDLKHDAEKLKGVLHTIAHENVESVENS